MAASAAPTAESPLSDLLLITTGKSYKSFTALSMTGLCASAPPLAMILLRRVSWCDGGDSDHRLEMIPCESERKTVGRDVLEGTAPKTFTPRQSALCRSPRSVVSMVSSLAALCRSPVSAQCRLGVHGSSAVCRLPRSVEVVEWWSAHSRSPRRAISSLLLSSLLLQSSSVSSSVNELSFSQTSFSVRVYPSTQ